MTDNFEQENKFTRRSMMCGAVKLGGGAVLAAAVPPLAHAGAIAHVSPLQLVAGSAAQSAVQSAVSAQVSTQRFTPEILSNMVFKDLALNFNSPDLLRVDGAGIEAGAVIQSSGDILFRIYAPNAKNVTLKFSQVRNGELALAKK